MRLYSRQRFSATQANLRHNIDWQFLLLLIAIAFVISGVRTYFLGSPVFANQAWLTPELSSALEDKKNAVDLLSRVSLFGRVFAAWFVGLIIPSVLFTISTNFALSSFTKIAQRLIAVLAICALAFVSQRAMVVQNPAWDDQVVSSFSSQFFMGLRSVLYGISIVGIVIPLILGSEKKGAGVTRFSVVIAFVSIFLVYDLYLSKKGRSIPAALKAANIAQSYVIIVPELTLDIVENALSHTGSGFWAQRKKFAVPVVPSSTSVVSQFVTLVTGKEPFEHGIRGDYPQRHSVKLARSTVLSQNWGDETIAPFTFVGSLEPSFEIVSSVRGAQGCSATLENYYRVAVLHSLKTPLAILPDTFVKALFPFYRCDQKYSPLDALVKESLLDQIDALQGGGSNTRVLFVNPNPYLGNHGVATEPLAPTAPAFGNPFSEKVKTEVSTGAPLFSTSRSSGDAVAKVRARILAKTLVAIEDFFRLTGLEENARVYLVGLNSSNLTQSAFVAFEGSRVVTNSSLDVKPGAVLPLKQLHKYLFVDTSFSPLSPAAYTEIVTVPVSSDSHAQSAPVLKFEFSEDLGEHMGTLDRELEKLAVFRSSKIATCRDETDRMMSRILEQAPAQAPAEDKLSDCEKEFRKIEHRSRNDITLATSRRL